MLRPVLFLVEPLSAYPTARRLLDYEALDSKRLCDGLLVRKDGRFHRVPDPLRHPRRVVAMVPGPNGSLIDKRLRYRSD
jgi:hypothetical protein